MKDHINDSQAKWHYRFLEMADLVAGWSKDPSTKVGAVLVNKDRHVIGVGYNGFPRGVCDHEDRLSDRELKYALTVHAEENAVANSTADVTGATCYVTHAPCAHCTAIMIQHGISRIYTWPTPEGLAQRFAESYKAAAIMRSEAGMEMVTLPRRED